MNTAKMRNDLKTSYDENIISSDEYDQGLQLVDNLNNSTITKGEVEKLRKLFEDMAYRHRAEAKALEFLNNSRN